MDESIQQKMVKSKNNFSDKEWDEYINMRLHSHVFQLEEKCKNLANSLNIIADYLKSIGIIVKFFSTDCGHLNKETNEYTDGMLSYGYFSNLKEEYWLKEKYIQCYTRKLDALGSNIHKYSNHFSKINNLLIAQNIYNELIELI
jgi:hypothetical protein